ncbi:hypothetical protein ACNGTP_08700 [Bisgaard Taxon 45]
MKYFDTKKSLPVLCSLLIAACSGGGGGNNNVPHPPVEKRTVVPKQKAAEKPALSTHTESKPNLATPTTVVNKAVAAAPEPIMNASVTTYPTAKLEKLTPPKEETVKQVLPAQEKHKSIAPEWTGTEQKQYRERSWNHSPEKVPVFKVIPNEKYQYSHEKLFEIEPIEVNLTEKNLSKKNDFNFKLVDDTIYFGYYLDSTDLIKTEYNYVIAFDKNKENIPEKLTAKYYSEKGFSYSVKTENNRGEYYPQAGDVYLSYTDGSIEGKIVDNNKHTVFNLKNSSDNNPNQIMFVPDKENKYGFTPKGSDNMIMDVHFVEDKNGEKFKYIVGSGKADKYYGALFATKQEE